MPLAGRLDIVHDGGSTLSRTFALTDSLGAAINLTGYLALMQVRATWNPGGALYASFGTTAPYSGLTIPTPANGQIILGPIDRTALAGIPATGEMFVWDLFIYQPAGVETRILFGNFRLRQIATEVP